MTRTHCPYCSLQCGMTLQRKGRAGLEVLPWAEFPVNEGALCRKGWTAAELRGHRERLTTPMIKDRTTGELRAAGWDEALDLIAGKIQGLQASYGADSVAVFGGGGLTNEKAYQLGKFARVALGTSQIDYNGRWCMSSAASAGNQAFGVDRGLPFPLADVEQADVVVLVGSNLAETMPPAARHLDRLRERGGKLVVIDPRQTADRRARRPLPAARARHRPRAGARAHCTCSTRQAPSTRSTSPPAPPAGTRSAARSRRGGRSGSSGSPASPTSELRELVDLLASHDKVMILTARGAEQHSQGTATVLGWINVALALGMPGTSTPATAASPARATARAGASTARRPTSCRATG